MKYIIVFIAAPSLRQGKKIADVLISRRLAACVNIVNGVESFFMWQGERERAKEVLLIAKTKLFKFKELQKQVKKNHSYEIPEIIAIPIIAGNHDYLKWIDDSV